VSTDEIYEFYIRELQPFVNMHCVRQRWDGLQWNSVDEVQDGVGTNNVTLYGSTQLVMDLAELAAEAGNKTFAFDDAGSASCTQSQTTSKTDEPGVADEHSGKKTVPSDVPIVLDGFCLQSSSVSFLHIKNVLVPH